MGFGMDLKAFAAKAKGNADLVVRKVVIDMGTEIVSRSPVGDPTHWDADFKSVMAAQGWSYKGYVGGRFRANWQYGTASKPDGVLDTTDKSGGQAIARISGSVPTNAAGKVHFLTNNLPYALRLENGYSKQAPSGMVGLTVLKFQQYVAANCAAVNK